MKTLTQHLNEKLVIIPSRVDEKLVIIPSRVDEKLVIIPSRVDEKLVIIPSRVDEKLVIIPSRVDEKLVINKNFKSSDILDEIKNAEWTKDPNAGKQTEDLEVFDKFVTYVRETNPKEISYVTASRRVNKDKYLCGINAQKKIMVLYHKSDVEHDLYERIGIGIVSSSPERKIMFTYNLKMLRSAIAPMNLRSAFFSSGKYYQYEIPKETFEALANLYKEL